MLIPGAPLAISAEEPRVPQACSALRALEQSLKTGTSFDIVFQAYTRRLSLGSVAKPMPIYANTAVLQTTTLLPDFGTFYSYFSFMAAAEHRSKPKKNLISPPSLNCPKATHSLLLL
jgi:hypothetical protein